MTDAGREPIPADWVDWWKPSESQVQWQAALVEYKRKQLIAQAEAGGYGQLVTCLVPPEYEFDVDIVDPDPTAEEVDAMRAKAAGTVEPLPIPDGDWSMFDDDHPEDIEFLKWLDARFPMGWDWVRWLDRASPEGTKFFSELHDERPDAADFFLYDEDDR